MKMTASHKRLIVYKMSERQGKMLSSGVIQRRGQCLQIGKIGRAFKIENPTLLFSLEVVLESDFPQRLYYLRRVVTYTMWFTYESDNYVAASGLIQDHLGMAGRDNLAAYFMGYV